MTVETQAKRVFILRDFEIEGIKNILEYLKESPPAGYRVEVPGLGSQLAMGRIFEDQVRRQIEGAAKGIALLDKPNANVAFELGYALGKGIPTALACVRKPRPEWLASQVPFKGCFVASVPTLSRWKELVQAEESEWIQVEVVEAASEDTLFLCSLEAGETYHSVREDMGLGWGVLDPQGWGWPQLGEKLRGYGRLVWTISPAPAGADRDGPENTAAAVVAGYGLATGRELIVLRSDEARPVADVEPIEQVFESLSDYQRMLERLAAPPEARRASEGGEAEDAVAAYREYLVAAHEHLIPFFDADQRPLDEVFVSVRIAAGPESRQLVPEGSGRGKAELFQRELKLRELLELDPAKDGQTDDEASISGRWVLLGEPGAGKSTLCRQLCHELGGEPDAPIPVLIQLARWMREPYSPFEIAQRAAAAWSSESRVQGLARQLEAEGQRQGGRLRLLLDGLDEVERSDQTELRQRLAELSKRCPYARIVVMSRPAGYAGPPAAEFRSAQLQALEPRSQRQLLEGWLGVTQAAEVWERIRDRPRLLELARNPLLLTLMAKLQAGGAELPRTRSGLYAAAVDLLLERGFGAKEAPGVRDRVSARKLLRPLALGLQSGDAEMWSFEELHGVLGDVFDAEPGLESQLRAWDRSASAFLEDVGRGSGVIAAHDGEGLPWRFLHRSLREHLAAEALASRADDAAAPEIFERLRADTPRWGEVFALFCGLLSRDDPRRSSLLRDLVSSDRDLALRTLPQLEGLEPAEALGLLDEVPADDTFGVRWDGDDLRRLLNGLLLEGQPPELLRDLVLASIVPGSTTRDLAYRHYALEASGIGVERAAFFDRCERPISRVLAIDYVPIPGGTFMMGSPENEPERCENERQHEVRLAAFELAATAVTNEAYAAFDPEHEPERLGRRVSRGQVAKHPVVNVCWWEAYLYSRWIGAQLPTEAQWEYACRAGTETPFLFGEDITPKLVNYDGNHPYRGGEKGEYRERTVPVALLPPNDWGLCEMHGNVWEWCRDWYDDGYAAEPREGDALREPQGSSYRVFRGGSWGYDAQYARSAYRYDCAPASRFVDVGFRPARHHS